MFGAIDIIFYHIQHLRDLFTVHSDIFKDLFGITSDEFIRGMDLIQKSLSEGLPKVTEELASIPKGIDRCS